jgi:NADH-quinone oxidoreductase subunit J
MVGEPQVGIVFWLLSFVILVSAFMVVSLKNIFHCALFLVVCLFSVAGIFVLLHAEFLAAAQVLIYVGAVAILIIFAIMLTSNLASAKVRATNENVLVGFFVSLILALGTIVLIGNTHVWQYAEPQAVTDSNVMLIGKYLMTQYMLPFELVSVLLLAALIGAIVLARKEKS